MTVFDISKVTHEGYRYLFILPLIYMLITTLRCIFVPKGIVIKIIDTIYFMKFVILSFMVVCSGWYEGRAVFSPLIQSFNMAILYMVTEFLLINLFYYFILRKRDINIKNNNLSLKFKDYSKDIIYIFFLFVNLIFLIFSYKNLSFLGLGHIESYEEQNQFMTLLTISLYISKYFIIGYIIRYFYLKYTINNNNIYVFYSVVLSIMVSSIFIGNNRMDAILPVLSMFILLNYLYKNKMKIYNIIISLFIVISVYLISLLRNTFDYQITDKRSGLITDYIQIYMSGIYNTAISLEIENLNHNNVLITFAYDLIRPFLGLNLIWRSETIKTSSELFNYKIFGVEDHVTQIIPLIGQFNLPFGWFGIPISIFIITVLLYFFLKMLQGVYVIEAMVIMPIIIRLCITYFQNFSIFINELSSIMIIFGILKLLSIILKKITST